MADEKVKSNKEKELEEEMKRYGIERIPIDYFHINGFRYTALEDAIVQAKRSKAVIGSR